MVKMAYSPIPKLLCKPIGMSKMYSPDTTKTTLSEVLQSEPVKRLFNQPNIIIKTIPLKINTTSASNNNVLIDKKNGLSINVHKAKQLQVSVSPTITLNEGYKEDDNLLPSKTDGKSEISLLPIKQEQKSCGHYEPCESIVCDVAVQQYVDRDGASPMLAINIEEDEINAPVSKHCTNERCDALSIDHNRCRRAMIKLHRCDQSKTCDICGVTLKMRKSRVCHKKCTRKYEYRHNETNGAQVLKERMREREIEMMEALKVKKKDYLDPVIGHSLAMEALRNNEELIVIPKSIPMQQPTITITSVPATQSAQQVNNGKNVFGNLLPNIPIVLPQQSIVFGKTQCSMDNNTSTPKVTFSNNLNRPFITTNNTIPQNQYIRVESQSNVHPIALNDLLLSQSQIISGTPIQPKPLLTPIRVVPITNLISQPSLLHRTQGIPKFCIMADSTIAPITMSNPQPAIPSETVLNSSDQSRPKVMLQKKKKSPIRRKRRLKKKEFKCEYCYKCFSTDWYFRMHVAMHKGEKLFSCKICSQSFKNRYDMERHMNVDHRDGNESQDKSDQDIATAHNGSEECDEEMKEINGDSSDVLTETDVPSSIKNTKVNNLQVPQDEGEDNVKRNGFVSSSAEKCENDI